MTSDAEAASVGDESMAYVDCDTIPYLWMYASRFALFDSFFQGVRAPSAPSNVEIIAAQNGETEYARYGAAGPPYTATADRRGRPRRPDVRRSRPGMGPVQQGFHSAARQVDQTYANVLLNLEGTQARTRSRTYTQDIRDDIAFLAARSASAGSLDLVSAGLRESGRSRTACRSSRTISRRTTSVHREQPVDEPRHCRHHALRQPTLPQGELGAGGLFYLKGGYGSNQRLQPPSARPHTFLGDDDHPGEADLQIAEADVAATRQHDRAQPILEQRGDRDHVGRSGRLLGSRPAAEVAGLSRRQALRQRPARAAAADLAVRARRASCTSSTIKRRSSSSSSASSIAPRWRSSRRSDATALRSARCSRRDRRLDRRLRPGSPARRAAADRSAKADIPDGVVARIPTPSSCRSIGLRHGVADGQAVSARPAGRLQSARPGGTAAARIRASPDGRRRLRRRTTAARRSTRSLQRSSRC